MQEPALKGRLHGFCAVCSAAGAATARTEQHVLGSARVGEQGRGSRDGSARMDVCPLSARFRGQRQLLSLGVQEQGSQG